MDKQKSTTKMEHFLLTETKGNTLFDPYTNSTPKPRKQIEYMLSPYFCDVQKDLFSQLLGTESKYISPGKKNYSPIRSKDEYDFEIQELNENQGESQINQSMQNYENEYNQNREEGRKRKRKSNSQIKLLKQQFDKEGSWTKEKILKMAQITGLSESQVYKWCWDQKKKTNGCKDLRRVYQNYEESHQLSSFGDQEESEPKNDPKTKQIKKSTRTKRKVGMFNDSKQILISKKLLFG